MNINVNDMFRSFVIVCCLISASSPQYADRYVLPPEDVDLVGFLTSYEVAPGTFPIDIARRRGIGQEEFLLANPDLKRWLPVSTTEYKLVQLPTRYILPAQDRHGLVINLAEKRLYYFPTVRNDLTPPVLLTYPVSIGRADWQTPITNALVVRKKTNPSWYPPASIKAEAAERGVVLPDVVTGPDNPLGQHAIYLDIPGYLIHGTSNPYDIGLRVTHGCVRMYPEDISYLFTHLPLGIPVNIVHEPVKVGWYAGKLHIEVHAPLPEFEISDEQLFAHAVDLVESAIDSRPLKTALRSSIRRIVETSNGLPTALRLSPTD